MQMSTAESPAIQDNGKSTMPKLAGTVISQELAEALEAWNASMLKKVVAPSDAEHRLLNALFRAASDSEWPPGCRRTD